MQEKLIIYLSTESQTHPSWAVVDAKDKLRQSAYQDSAEGLAAIAAGKEIIVLVPAEDVLLLPTRLPKMSRARLKQALPYAIEEQLIADVETLHFAVSEREAEGDLTVAVVAHEKMQHWLALLQSWKITPHSMLPVSLALPVQAQTWHIFLADMAIFRPGLLQGFACDLPNFRDSLTLALTKAIPPPALIYLHNYTQAAVTQDLDLPVKIKEDSVKREHIIADLAHQAAKKPAINLLQNNYNHVRKKSTYPHMKKIVQATLFLALAWVGLLFFYPTVSYFIFKNKLQVIDSEIAKIYKNNFPQANNVIAPKAGMQKKLQKLNGQVGANRLLLLLGYVGKGLAATPTIQFKQIEFQNNQFTLELTAASSDDFTAFTSFLSQQGLSVKQQNANLSGERVNALLVIE